MRASASTLLACLLCAAASPAQTAHNYAFTDDDSPRPTPYAHWSESGNYDDRSVTGAVQGVRFRLRQLLQDGWSGSSAHAIKVQYGSPLTNQWEDVGQQGDTTRVFRHFDSSLVLHQAKVAAPLFTSDHQASSQQGLVQEAPIAAWTDPTGTNSYTEEEVVLELSQSCASPTTYHFRFVVDGVPIPQSNMHGGAGNEPRMTCVSSGSPLLGAMPGPANPGARSVLPGSASVPGLQFRLTAGAQGGVSFRMAKVSGQGSGNDFTEITAVRLFHDADESGTVTAGDVQLGTTQTFPADDGTIVFNFDVTPQVIGASSSAAYLVTYDFAPGASPGKSFTASVASRGRLLAWSPAGTQPVVAAGSFPLSGGQLSISAPATALAFATTAQTISAGACSGVLTVQSRDSAGNPAAVPTSTSVGLATTSTGGAAFIDPACTTQVTGVTIQAGGDSASFFYRDTVAGAPDVTAWASGLASAIQTQTVGAAPPSQLEFRSAPLTAAAGSCNAVTLEARDAFQNPSKVAAATLVDLTTTSAGGAFHLNASCTLPASSVTIAQSTSAVTFYYRDTLAGTPQLGATSPSLTGTSQQETINPATPSQLAFVNAPLTLAAGACSPGLLVQSRDQYGNPANGAVARTVNLATSSTDGWFYSDPSCNVLTGGVAIPPGASTATFFYRDTAAGAAAVTVSSSGLTFASQTEAVSAAPPSKLAFATGPVASVAGSCSAALSVEVRDPYDNPSAVSASTWLSLLSDSATATFHPTSSCGSAVSGVAIPAGAAAVSFHLWDSRAGGLSLTASASGLGSVNQPATVTAKPPSTLAFVTPSQTVTAGACSAAIKVQAQDEYGNQSPVTTTATVALGTTSGTGELHGSAGCGGLVSSVAMPSGTSEVDFYYRDSTAGAATLSASSPPLLSAAQGVTISGAGVPSRLALLGPALNLTAGSCSAGLTVQTQDSFGTPVNVASPTTVSLKTTSATGSFHLGSSCGAKVGGATIAVGSNSFTAYYQDLTAGTPALGASAAQLTSASRTETVYPAAATAVVFATLPLSLSAGVCSPAIDLEARDGFGNRSNLAVANSIALGSDSPLGSFYSNPSCSLALASAGIGAGASTTPFHYRDLRAGSATLTASPSGGLSGDSQTQLVAPAAAAKLAFTTAPAILKAGNCSLALTVQVRDSFNNPRPVASATQVNLSSTSAGAEIHPTAACAGAVSSVTVAAGSDSASLYYRDTVAGSPAITASAAGLAPASQTESVGPAAPSELAFTTPPLALTAGPCSPPITVQARDVHGNPTVLPGGAAVNLGTTSAGGAFYSDFTCSTLVTAIAISAGASSATFHYSDIGTGTPSLTASSAGLNAATQVASISADAASRLVFLSQPQSLIAGSCSAAATVQFQDAFGNPAPPPGPYPVSLSSTSARATFFSDASCAILAPSLNAASGSSTVTFHFRDLAAGSPALTASALGLAQGSQPATIAPAQVAQLAFATPARILSAGACSTPITVQTRDAYGNPSAVPAPAAVSLGTTSSGGGFFSDPACLNSSASVTVPTGGRSATFYYRDTVAGASGLTASSAALSSATQTNTVVAGSPAKLAISMAAAPVVRAGACSEIIPFWIQDAYGNRASLGAASQVGLSSSRATAAFYSDAACTDGVNSLGLLAGQDNSGFFFVDPATGPLALTASMVGLTPASQAATVVAGPPFKLAFVTSPQEVGVDTCSAMSQVELRDALGNSTLAEADIAIPLQSNSGGMSFFGEPDCRSPVSALQLAKGGGKVDFHFQDAAAGSPVITASGAGLASASQSQTVRPAGPPAKLAFTSAPKTIEAGVCSSPVVLQAQDGSGAASRVAASTEVAVGSSSASGGFYLEPNCSTKVAQLALPAGDYRLLLHYRDGAAGTPIVTATAPGLSAGTQTETILCPASVDGAPCDDGDACNGRETCQGGACATGSPLSCDDGDACTVDSCDGASGCANAPRPGCCQQPAIRREANLAAAVGVRYRYSAFGKPSLLRGQGPFTWSLCDSPPPGARMDPKVGVLDWTPTAQGGQPVCLEVAGSCGEDTYRFTVQVIAAPPARPLASMSLSPVELRTGDSLSADASQSAGLKPFAVLWDWGDATARATGITASHVYAQAGVYRVRARVFDAVGQSAWAGGEVRVTGGGCDSPPRVRIVSDRAEADGQLDATFRCDCQVEDSGAVYLWDFGDGAASRGREAQHTFLPGEHQVSLAVITAQGCVGRDQLSVRVTASGAEPPRCEVAATPALGPAPLRAELTASFGDEDGSVASAAWSFSDGVRMDALRTDGAVERTLLQPSRLTARLTVTDDAGLTCVSAASVEAANASGVQRPEIASLPTLEGTCGVAYRYGEDGRARALGTHPLTWSLGKGKTEVGRPRGMSIDPATGELLWTPSEAEAGENRVSIVAENSAGAAAQEFLVKVECRRRGGCGCGLTGAAYTLLALATVLALRRRR
ncbi:MAG: PKD domain-containing protein [Myxococcales bacterium]|nr:PKD domain-containing protein [Myxococcales bacterium]